MILLRVLGTCLVLLQDVHVYDISVPEVGRTAGQDEFVGLDDLQVCGHEGDVAKGIAEVISDSRGKNKKNCV